MLFSLVVFARSFVPQVAEADDGQIGLVEKRLDYYDAYRNLPYLAILEDEGLAR